MLRGPAPGQSSQAPTVSHGSSVGQCSRFQYQLVSTTVILALECYSTVTGQRKGALRGSGSAGYSGQTTFARLKQSRRIRDAQETGHERLPKPNSPRDKFFHRRLPNYSCFLSVLPTSTPKTDQRLWRNLMRSLGGRRRKPMFSSSATREITLMMSTNNVTKNAAAYASACALSNGSVMKAQMA